MTVHVARLMICKIDAAGNRIDPNDKSTTINSMLSFSTENRVIPDAQIPSSAGYPTIKQYLELEAAGSYKLQHLDQSFVITYNG